MAVPANTQIFDQTQETPGSAVLTALAGRLRSHAANLHNPTAKKTLGADLVRAADVVELLASGDHRAAVQAAAAVAWLGRRGYASWTGEAR